MAPRAFLASELMLDAPMGAESVGRASVLDGVGSRTSSGAPTIAASLELQHVG
jgi:hypothetical protein